ncbi:MAG: N-formylglutamate amidohydrolase [Planctomycetes bacterium]|nr:N-formylglutamate amidohydrolase [Planctomycetota bacterium]
MELPRSIPKVCEVELVRGAAAGAAAAPDLLLEVAHGATTAAHFDGLRAELRGDYDGSLRDFFFVNTDVGAPELAAAIARAVVAADPRRSALIVRCLVPRTFVDCNRRVDDDTIARAAKAGEMTPGLQPWVQLAADRALLLERYRAYRDAVTAAFAAVCGHGGTALCVHSYAPRSVDVAVDADVGKNLRLAYAPDRVGSWPLRAPVDLITHDPDGRALAAPRLTQLVQAELAAAGFEVAQNGAYSLHPVTLAHGFAVRYPARTLCFEVRRDLLVPEFVPFVELHTDAKKIAAAAAPFARALLADLG